MATLVFGLDGANWPLLEPWLKEGQLPTIRRLRNEGSWGVSRSVLPPVTCPNWKCYASSRSPGHHDVYWWEKVDKTTGAVDVPDAASFSAPELWDYCNNAGLTTAVMNLPMSFPPRELDGAMVAGGPRTREEGFTHPPELERELADRYGYQVHPTNVVTSNEDAVEPTLNLIETRFEAAHDLLENRGFEFLHLTIFI